MRPGDSALAGVAAVTQRLAVLLAAGVAPMSAWAHVAESSASAIPARVVAAASGSAELAARLVEAAGGLDRLEAGAWRGLAAAWSVASVTGAPIAPSLRDYAESMRSLAQAQRETRVALAAPVATARMVMVLPAIGVLFGLALGFNTLGTLFTTPPGWACLVLGAALITAAARWNRRLVAAAQPSEASPGLECDLMAIAVSGGGSLDGARSALGAAAALTGLTVHSERIDAVLDLSRRAGVPAAELLRAEAEEARREAQAVAREKAAALSVRLMLPLGLCILPAFMVLGVFPLLVTVISSTVATW